MNKGLSTSFEYKHDSIWVTLPDSIDMDNYLQIEQMILDELQKSELDIVLDFSQTKSLFSSGIGLIVRLNKQVSDKKRKIYLVNIEKKIKEGLENVGLDKTLSLYDNEKNFLESQQ